MMDRAVAILAGACAVIGAACLYEVLAPLPAYSVPAVSAKRTPVLAAPQAPFAPPSEAAYAAVTERPLFDPQRKKYVPPPTPEQDKAAPPPPPTLFLVGVIIDSDRRMAMVKSSEGTLASSVAVGAEIGGWQVADIEPDRIVLKAGTAQDEIRLDANKAAPQASQPQQSAQGTSPAAPASHQAAQQQQTGQQPQSTP